MPDTNTRSPCSISSGAESSRGRVSNCVHVFVCVCGEGGRCVSVFFVHVCMHAYVCVYVCCALVIHFTEKYMCACYYNFDVLFTCVS